MSIDIVSAPAGTAQVNVIQRAVVGGEDPAAAAGSRQSARIAVSEPTCAGPGRGVVSVVCRRQSGPSPR